MSKYLNITEIYTPETQKTRRWLVTNSKNHVILGHIKWATNFRKYTFYPVADTMYSPDCLDSLGKFCNNKTVEHKTFNPPKGKL